MNKINENSRIKGVVFDLDHTLFDRYGTLKLTLRDILLEHPGWISKRLTEQQASELVAEADGKHIIEGWKRVYEYWCEKGIVGIDENGTPVVAAKELFDYIWNYSFLRHAVKYPFVNPMLDELRNVGLKVGLITNASGEDGIKRQNAKLKILEMTDKFDEILISGELDIHKPDRRVFDVMAERLGIPAENMLYVGDNPKVDIVGAKGAGYIPVWVRLREEYGEKAECELSVKDVSEIPFVVDRLNCEG